ncbi:16S rRNA (uracil(1498)-N(3))-methyltransferase [Aureisphaera galaxeae]|uniref:16S rRNA (uracil(1498)-N(3))-methyltransferase n=1 Tax=Aureisphaera galaxeae TaxID=1538023 RepID=UPI002350FCDB|nr:16S rRNA (uracil(1498)-N(3))-methyltransferase [Aureisphaera galaxeae]MDC8004169.1 16S rRNA (uracil(1498)-N(3))-methyltransferase [Aureisphaera galaxeae]
MNLFYHPNIDTSTTEIVFDKEESRHIAKVLRKKEGDLLDVTNGKGNFFSVEIVSLMPKQCLAIVKDSRTIGPLPYQLHMAVAPTKNNDRFEWFLEKATEIGIHRITPIICEHSERRVIKKDRFERIIESAMKQSLKAHKPILEDAVAFNEFIESQKGSQSKNLMAFCGAVEKSTLKQQVAKNESVVILIGPEGDFSYKEYELAKQYGFEVITLGNSRLRTETAAIAACHGISFLHQN